MSTPHTLRTEQAEAFASHVQAQPGLIDTPTPMEGLSGVDEQLVGRINNLRTARAARHTASLLRRSENGEVSDVYTEWLTTDPTAATIEALSSDQPLPPETEAMPTSILGVERDLDRSRTERLRLLWTSGQEGGLGRTDRALLSSWGKRIGHLKEHSKDLFNRLRLEFTDLPEEQAIEKTRQAADKKARVVAREHAKTAKRDGIIHIPSTDELAETLMPQIGAGKHVLLMGPRGTAKTAIAKSLAHKAAEFSGSETPFELASLKPDTPFSEIIGRWKLIGGESIFEAGPLARALTEGSVFIANEFNNAGHDVVSSFEEIMLLKPGEPFTLQQGDSHIELIRHKNFCVIANANVKGKIHSERSDIDAAMRERFTGGIHEVTYPDVDVTPGENPEETIRLIETFLIDDKSGLVVEPNGTWTADDVYALATLSQWTQFLATHAAIEVPEGTMRNHVDSVGFHGTERPPLQHVVLGPRATLEQVLGQAQADPTLSLADSLARFADAPDLRLHIQERNLFGTLMVELDIMSVEDVRTKLHLPSFRATAASPAPTGTGG